MHIIALAVGLAVVIELITIYLRLVFHRESSRLQKQLHIPRIHHSYPGLAILLLDYVYLQNEWLFVLGFALVLSDIFHHLVFEPFIKKNRFDIGMRNHRQAHYYATQVPAAVALIIIGLFALVTPFTPGSWLTLIGAGILIGKDPHALFLWLKRHLKKLIPTRT